MCCQMLFQVWHVFRSETAFVTLQIHLQTFKCRRLSQQSELSVLFDVSDEFGAFDEEIRRETIPMSLGFERFRDEILGDDM